MTPRKCLHHYHEFAQKLRCRETRRVWKCCLCRDVVGSKPIIADTSAKPYPAAPP